MKRAWAGGSGDERVAYMASNIGRGLRMSTARAFLRPARRRPNVTVLDRATVERVTFDGTRATGVLVRREGRTRRFTARREVILAAGGLDSPLLLERSGIGRPDILQAAGVPVVACSPHVGEHMRDHTAAIAFQVRLRRESGFNPKLRSWVRQGWSGFTYLFTRSGVMAHGAYNVALMHRSDPAGDGPDTQTYFTPISAGAVDPKSGRMIVDKHAGGMVVTYMLFPTSEGSVHITGASAVSPARLIPNILSSGHDRALVPHIYRKTRRILQSEPFASLVAAETIPGTELATDEEIRSYALRNGGSGYHTVGTCRIGTESDAVVDDRLRVRGVTGLRVIDASVFPAETSGNNNAPTVALAWIGADIVLEDLR